MSDPSEDYEYEVIDIDDFLSARQGRMGGIERYNARDESTAYDRIADAGDRRVSINAHFEESDFAVNGIFENPGHGIGMTGSYLIELIDNAGSLQDAINIYGPGIGLEGDIDGFQIVIHG